MLKMLLALDTIYNKESKVWYIYSMYNGSKSNFKQLYQNSLYVLIWIIFFIIEFF